MGFKLSGTESDYRELTIVDETDRTITTYNKIETLFESGLRFESCIAQAAILEAICYYYLILAKTQNKLTFDKDSEKKIKTNDLTFGRTKNLLIDNKILLDDELADKLKGYVENRNLIAHRLISEMKIIDFDAFHKDGKELIFYIWGLILKSTEKFRAEHS